MRLHSLAHADIYRDGGSLAAVFRTTDGKVDAVCLKANILALSGIGKLYSDLYWFRDEVDPVRSFMNSLSNDTLVQPGSELEKMLMEELAAFLANPRLDSFEYYANMSDKRLDKVRKIFEEIPNREHFDRIIHREAIKLWELNLTKRH